MRRFPWVMAGIAGVVSVAFLIFAIQLAVGVARASDAARNDFNNGSPR